MVAESEISEDLFEKIVAFVDRELGCDAPLNPADEAFVRRLIKEDTEVSALVEDLRETNKELNALLDNNVAVDVPDHLVGLIQNYPSSKVAIFAPNPEGRMPSNRGGNAIHNDKIFGKHNYRPYAIAASFALLICCSAIVYIYNSFAFERTNLEATLAEVTQRADAQASELAEVQAEVRLLADLREQASGFNQGMRNELTTNVETVLQLEVEQADLKGRYTVLEEDNLRLEENLAQQRIDIAESESIRDKAARQLATAESDLQDRERQSEIDHQKPLGEVDRLKADLGLKQQLVTSLTNDLIDKENLARTSSETLTKARNEQATLERRLAKANFDKEELIDSRTTAIEAATTAAAEAELRLTSLKANLINTEGQLATAISGLSVAEDERREVIQRLAGLEADIEASRDWLGQIAQYHRVYASTARRHLVEIGADEVDYIQEWMTDTIGREVEIPNLTDYRIIFVGARLLGINDKPVAQLMYLDEND